MAHRNQLSRRGWRNRTIHLEWLEERRLLSHTTGLGSSPEVGPAIVRFSHEHEDGPAIDYNFSHDSYQTWEDHTSPTGATGAWSSLPMET